MDIDERVKQALVDDSGVGLSKSRLQIGRGCLTSHVAGESLSLTAAKID